LVLKDIFREVLGYARKSIPRDRLIYFFNSAEREIFNEHNQFFNKKISTKVSTVANQRNYPIPSDSREVFKVFLAESFNATANTETVGTLISGDFSDTDTDNDVEWVTAPTGSGLDVFLTFQVSSDLPVSIFINGRYEANPGEFVDVFAFNFDTSAFVQLSTATNRFDNSTTDSGLTFTLSAAQISSTGEVRIRFQTADTDTTNRMKVDQCILNSDELNSTELLFVQENTEVLLDKVDIPTVSNLAMFFKIFFIPTEITLLSDVTKVTQSLPEPWVDVLIKRMQIEADLDRYGTSNLWTLYRQKIDKMAGKTESRRSFQTRAFDLLKDGTVIPRF